MTFQWGQKKARDNIRDHKITFEKAAEVFDDPRRYVFEDVRYVYGEERYTTMGLTHDLLLVVVVYTYRGEDDEITRIITAREAEPHERGIYGRRRNL